MKKPRITLVYPSYSSMIGASKFRRFGVYAGMGKIPERPNIGLGYISQALMSAGYDHDFVDMNLLDSYSEFKKRTKKYAPDIIGLMMVTIGYLKGYKFIRRIRKDFPKTKIIVGGPHVGLRLDALLRECPEIDVGFISEAEKSLIAYLSNGARADGIDGVVYRKGRKIVFTPPTLEQDLGKIDFPKYEKFDLSKYSGIGLYTTRGCPFRCIFCSVESYRRKIVRQRPLESVMEEIRYWYERGHRLFTIEDDNFTFDMKRTWKLCRQLEKEKLPDIQFALAQGARADRINKRLLMKMYQVGFKYITIAVEAGNNRMLRNLKKGEKIETIKRNIKNACDIGYEVRLLFVIGTPGETWKDIEDSLKLACSYPIMYCRFNNLLPIPGTALYDWVIKEKLYLAPPEKFLNNYDLDCTEPFYETKELSAEERRRAIVMSDRINQKLFYRYLIKKLGILGPAKYPLSFLASRKATQTLIGGNPWLYNMALKMRVMLSG